LYLSPGWREQVKINAEADTRSQFSSIVSFFTALYKTEFSKNSLIDEKLDENMG
jgi:hypothetical protein